jgi:hypothetical protein
LNLSHVSNSASVDTLTKAMNIKRKRNELIQDKTIDVIPKNRSESWILQNIIDDPLLTRTRSKENK